MMTKKDFIALADMVRDHNDTCVFSDNKFNEVHILALEEFCHQQNKLFNGTHWINYIYRKCGPNGGKIKQ